MSKKLGNDEVAGKLIRAVERIAQLEAELARRGDVIERLQRDLQLQARLRRLRDR